MIKYAMNEEEWDFQQRQNRSVRHIVLFVYWWIESAVEYILHIVFGLRVREETRTSATINFHWFGPCANQRFCGEKRKGKGTKPVEVEVEILHFVCSKTRLEKIPTDVEQHRGIGVVQFDEYREEASSDWNDQFVVVHSKSSNAIDESEQWERTRRPFEERTNGVQWSTIRLFNSTGKILSHSSVRSFPPKMFDLVVNSGRHRLLGRNLCREFTTSSKFDQLSPRGWSSSTFHHLLRFDIHQIKFPLILFHHPRSETWNHRFSPLHAHHANTFDLFRIGHRNKFKPRSLPICHRSNNNTLKR